MMVQRYIKPWTQAFEASYSAVILADSAAQKLHTKKSLAAECGAEVFISHCWNEAFDDFLRTLESNLDPEVVVWVCSLGIDQNVNIGAEIGDHLFNSPFARALQGATRVLLLMDEDAEPLTRVWCVLEAHLAFLWGKPYDMALPPLAESLDEAAWRMVGGRLCDLDMRRCKASHAPDKLRILALVSERSGGVEALNAEVRGVAAQASERATVLGAAAAGRAAALEAAPAVLLAAADTRGRTPAHVAAERGHAEVLALLHARRADLAARDAERRTPLSVAAEAGAAQSVERLLEISEDAVAELMRKPGKELLDCSQGLSPLHFAAASGSLEVVMQFLAARAAVQGNGQGDTPLSLAATWRHAAIMDALLEHRAEVNEETRAGFTPLHNASVYVDPINSRGSQSIQTLDDEAAILVLLQHGAIVDQKTKDGRTPTFLAAQTGRPKALQTLLAARADPSLTSKKSLSPMHAAAENNHCKCMRILFEARVDINQLTSSGSSPLKIAASSGWARASALLLEALANPEARGPAALSPLHVSVKRGKKEIARKLLDCRASAAARTPDGLTPAELAAEAGQEELLAELLRHQPRLASAPGQLLRDLAGLLAACAGPTASPRALPALEGALGLGVAEARDEVAWAAGRHQGEGVRDWDSLLALMMAGLEVLGPRAMARVVQLVRLRVPAGCRAGCTEP